MHLVTSRPFFTNTRKWKHFLSQHRVWSNESLERAHPYATILRPCPDFYLKHLNLNTVFAWHHQILLSALRNKTIFICKKAFNNNKSKDVMFFFNRGPLNLTVHSTWLVTTMTWRLIARSTISVTSRNEGQTRAGERGGQKNVSELIRGFMCNSVKLLVIVVSSDPFWIKQCIWIAHWYYTLGSVQFTHKDQLCGHNHHGHALREEVTSLYSTIHGW